MYLMESFVKLHGEDQDLVSGVLLVEQASDALQASRTDIDAYCSLFLQHSSKYCCKIKYSCFNATKSTDNSIALIQNVALLQSTFKCTIVIPFLDHKISELSSRFDVHMKKLSSSQVLPVKINLASSTEIIKAAIEFYSDDLSNPNVFDEKFEVWKLKWLQAPLQQRPETLSKTLQQCSSASFPNIFTLLKLFATLPLSSCSCERSGSSLKRLNNFLRCTQSGETICISTHTL